MQLGSRARCQCLVSPLAKLRRKVASVKALCTTREVIALAHLPRCVRVGICRSHRTVTRRCEQDKARMRRTQRRPRKVRSSPGSPYMVGRSRWQHTPARAPSAVPQQRVHTGRHCCDRQRQRSGCRVRLRAAIGRRRTGCSCTPREACTSRRSLACPPVNRERDGWVRSGGSRRANSIRSGEAVARTTMSWTPGQSTSTGRSGLVFHVR